LLIFLALRSTPPDPTPKSPNEQKRAILDSRGGFSGTQMAPAFARSAGSELRPAGQRRLPAIALSLLKGDGGPRASMHCMLRASAVAQSALAGQASSALTSGPRPSSATQPRPV
jgi:hypothetical protein